MLAVATFATVAHAQSRSGCVLTQLGGTTLTHSCPVPFTGVVVVDDYFDFDADGILDSDSIQCAVDCLDGDPLPEHEGSAGSFHPSFVLAAGGVLELQPHRVYRVSKTIRLPLGAKGAVLVRGNGATIQVAARADGGNACDVTLFARAPANVSAIVPDIMEDATHGWHFDNLRLRGALRGLDADAGCGTTNWIGIDVAGSANLTINRCQFDGLDVGVRLRHARVATIEDCSFWGVMREGILFDRGSPWRPSTSPVVKHCTFQLEAGSGSAIRSRDVPNLLVQSCHLDGSSSDSFIRDDGTLDAVEAANHQLTIQDVEMAGSRGLSLPSALIRTAAGGQLIVRGLSLQFDAAYISSPVVLVDASAARDSPLDLVVEDFHALPMDASGVTDLRFVYEIVPGTEHRVLFRNSVPKDDLRAAHHWVAQRPAHVLHETLESPDLRFDRDPDARRPGQLWFNTVDNALRFQQATEPDPQQLGVELPCTR